MSTQGHTPGVATPFDRCVAALRIWRDNDHGDSIVISRNEGITLLEGIYALRKEAAAAPDMLAALKPLASAAEAFDWVNEKNVSPEEVFLWSESRKAGIINSISVADVLRAVAAIAKAKGRS